jgi:DNA mismatch endonuclease (patch repair protein)
LADFSTFVLRAVLRKSLSFEVVVADVFTVKKRSEVMSHIRGRGNKETEVALAKLMRQNGIKGWCRNQPVFGKPDFTFRSARLAVFVDGCFWHGCPKHSNIPANNRSFWRKKLSANKARDRLVTRTLRSRGWHVLRIWEHELVRKNKGRCVQRIQRMLVAIKRTGVEKSGQVAGYP